MPKWKPERLWSGEDVFIIGGGVSLVSFNWELLKPELTIGCNDAYKHGKDVCKICIFGDMKWFETHQRELKNFKGTVFTNINRLLHTKLPWLWTMQRDAMGLYKESLAWNFSTGASAINLALILGAKRVYLLGFDMQLTNGKNNWHENRLDKPPDDIVFNKFREGFIKLKTAMPKVFPGTEIINITDNSGLDLFPKIGVKEFWSQRNAKLSA